MVDDLQASIGFIGMGHMGSHMAQRLLDAGYQLTVYDRTREKAQKLGERGAQVAQTVRELAAGCLQALKSFLSYNDITRKALFYIISTMFIMMFIMAFVFILFMF
ncbi:MAG: NAD(P)-binding domain-containing protein [Nitrososphaeraceae archaeon]|nr:NAD(P)-binding domain-containing protein [Nitrososphaeraceae archaeon]